MKVRRKIGVILGLAALSVATSLMAGVGAKAATASAARRPDGPAMGLKNFREILKSLAAVTQISASNGDIQDYYRRISGQLPQAGALSEFSPQSWLAAAGLGSVFCDHMIAKDADGSGKSGFNDGIDFTHGPSSVSATQRTQLAQRYILGFLQRPATQKEQDQLAQLFADQGGNTDQATDTRKGLLAVCASVAGSIEFLSN